MESSLGLGVYSVSEASRLTGVSSARIRRWFRGYEYRAKGQGHRMPPVVVGESREVDGQIQLSFLDLMEIRLIERFLDFGVGWRELRRAAQVGADLLKTPHPFASFRFRTDGRRMFADIADASSEKRLLELRGRQHVFREVIEPVLQGVEFDVTQAVRWWPLGRKRRVVVDPTRSFGKPIGATSGVPVLVLAGYAGEHGVHEAADWYSAPEAEVRDALAFAKRHAA